MKNLIKSFLVFTLTLVSIKADVAVGSNVVATNTVVVNAAAILQNITLFSTNNVPTIVRLLDGNLTTVTGAYTNYIEYSTNVVSSYITTTGVTNIMTNTVLVMIPSSHAAATNNTTAKMTLVVPANNVPITFSSVTIFNNKINLSNNLAGLSYVLQYRTP